MYEKEYKDRFIGTAVKGIRLVRSHERSKQIQRQMQGNEAENQRNDHNLHKTFSIREGSIVVNVSLMFSDVSVMPSLKEVQDTLIVFTFIGPLVSFSISASPPSQPQPITTDKQPSGKTPDYNTTSDSDRESIGYYRTNTPNTSPTDINTTSGDVNESTEEPELISSAETPDYNTTSDSDSEATDYYTRNTPKTSPTVINTASGDVNESTEEPELISRAETPDYNTTSDPDRESIDYDTRNTPNTSPADINTALVDVNGTMSEPLRFSIESKASSERTSHTTVIPALSVLPNSSSSSLSSAITAEAILPNSTSSPITPFTTAMMSATTHVRPTAVPTAEAVTMMFSTPRPKIYLEITLNLTFEKNLKNSSSKSFILLAKNITKELDFVYGKEYKKRFIGSVVIGFREGSIVVSVFLVFSDVSVMPSLKEVQDTLRASNLTLPLVSFSTSASQIPQSPAIFTQENYSNQWIPNHQQEKYSNQWIPNYQQEKYSNQWIPNYQQENCSNQWIPNYQQENYSNQWIPNHQQENYSNHWIPNYQQENYSNQWIPNYQQENYSNQQTPNHQIADI
ncbi:cell wall protein DAN4-like [Arapaima gigas]